MRLQPRPRREGPEGHAQSATVSLVSLVAPLLACVLLLAAPTLAADTPADTCITCHAEFPEPTGISANAWAQDIHGQKGLTCAACHGGDPKDPTPEGAMSKAKGFRGKPQRRAVPELCARCHSDAALMRQYNPSLRTDQFSQYKTSVHGRRQAQGDAKVAVCTDCHGVHGILPSKDGRAPVHPLNVAQTCSRCHSDAAYMKEYKLPTGQFADYQRSVHHTALVARGDLSAPTCSTCHGNHGAAPPGVAAVEHVCSTCHVFQAELFDKSPHKAAFSAMGAPACVSCHSNHRILPPSDVLLSASPALVCANCHTPGDAGIQAAGKMHSLLRELVSAIDRSDQLLQRAASSGMEVSQAELEQAQARDALTKARVAIHSFDPQTVEKDVRAGLAVADKTQKAGEAALRERTQRRLGLGVSLIAILAVLVGLRILIRDVESRNQWGGS